jgi:Zn-finger nucleic acid-binding protein
MNWPNYGTAMTSNQAATKDYPITYSVSEEGESNLHRRRERKSSWTDAQVKVLSIKGAKLERTTSDQCPVCGKHLDEYTVFSTRFESCSACGGIWLFKDELRRLKNTVEHGSMRWLNDEINNIEKTSAVATTRVCPKCINVKLVSVLFGRSSIVIDWCPHCRGMWLERGDFNSVIEYLKQELFSMPSKEIEKKVFEEAKLLWRGGPESTYQELLDFKATISGLINATIFEHPALVKLCMSLPQV